MDEDSVSVFAYEDEEGADPDPFNLTALTSVASKLFFPKECVIEKIAEGGFHKVRSCFSCCEAFFDLFSPSGI